MNQILYHKQKKLVNKTFIFYISILLLSTICFFLLFTFLVSKYNQTNNNQKKSSSLSYSVKLQALYKSSEDNINYPIIGTIEIKKINLNYPIFSYTNDELLNIGICKVSGPSINSKGNLCLAGHNLENKDFFSNLNRLSKQDIITIYDNNSNYINYSIYDIFEVNENDLNILSQNTNYKEITLITCNNINKKRIIVKAKEIE